MKSQNPAVIGLLIIGRCDTVIDWERGLNIVVIGGQYPDSLAKCVFVTLKDMGYAVYSVDDRNILFSNRLLARRVVKIGVTLRKIENFLIRSSSSFERRIYNNLCRLIEPYEPDLIITHSAWIPPEVISKLKQQTGATIVCWFPDHPANLGRQYLLAGEYDVLFFKDRFLVELAKRVGRNAYYLPECIQPKWHKKVELSEEEMERYGCDITIAGNLYYYRALILEYLLKNGYDIKIWGPPVPRWLKSPVVKVHQNHYVAELEKAKAFRAAKICLNTFQGEVSGVNLRTFEIAGCGGFQICEYRPEVEEFFTPNEEIIVFYNLKDLKEKIDYYLTHPEERQAIADRAYERAHREHTYEKRLKQMLKVIAEIKGSL